MNKKTSIKDYLQLLLISTRLGLTSFGGPVAHLAYFQDEYVKRRKWLDDKSFADLIALCQFLPGPASSQVGISIGMVRGGILGGIIAWLGFTLPSVLALILFGLFVNQVGVDENQAWLHGLKLVAVAVVAHAIVNMGKKLTPDKERLTLAIVAALIMLVAPSAWIQILVIIAAGLIGYLLYKKSDLPQGSDVNLSFGKRTGIVSLSIFTILLIGFPFIARALDNVWITIFDIFYRVGSIVFGGGHVVLPLLEQEVVPQGLVTSDQFLAGYGAAQAVPGPLFTFSSYLGTVMSSVPGGILATFAMFLPSFLLIVGVLPFWNQLRRNSKVRASLLGVNASVVGLLLAAFYDPIWTSGIKSASDFAIALGAFSLLNVWKMQAWLVVIITVGVTIGLNFVL